MYTHEKCGTACERITENSYYKSSITIIIAWVDHIFCYS
ncbi:hypothetical protein ALT1000_70171 [Alteromonas macleodii]